VNKLPLSVCPDMLLLRTFALFSHKGLSALSAYRSIMNHPVFPYPPFCLAFALPSPDYTFPPDFYRFPGGATHFFFQPSAVLRRSDLTPERETVFFSNDQVAFFCTIFSSLLPSFFDPHIARPTKLSPPFSSITRLDVRSHPTHLCPPPSACARLPSTTIFSVRTLFRL